MAEQLKIEDDFELEIETDEQETELQKPETAQPEVEIEDDTPEADRGRQPMPKELVEELEQDDLEEYSEKVKTKLKQMKKVWHDERRAKEQAYREQQEAITAAKRLLEENNHLKQSLTSGEKTLIETYTSRAELQLDQAKREYKEAYDSGDSDALVAAQEKMNAASYSLSQAKNYRPTTLQTDPYEVQSQQPAQSDQPNSKTIAWQERNTWFGTDSEMTASAMGLHQKLEKQYGKEFVGSDEYWGVVDSTMRRRFPEYFDGDEEPSSKEEPTARTKKPAPVVAPATRSTTPRKVRLTKSQLALSKKFGLTPEQYARELLKLED